ncbi:MAG: ABC transporter permease subunit [Lachnospiraceae bacterium]
MKKQEKSHGWTDKLYYVTRISTMIAFLLMFFSEFNPARVYSMMNKNVSLFTTAVSYDRLIVNVAFEMRIGVLTKGHFTMLMGAAALVCIGILALCVSSCISLGNLKFKKLSNICNLLGGAVMISGLYGIHATHGVYETLNDTLGYAFATDGFNGAFYVTAAIAIINIIVPMVLFVCQPRTVKGEKFEMATKYKLFLMFLPLGVLAFLFCYLPLYGWRFAFFDYQSGPNPLTLDDFVGLKWFRTLVESEATRKDIINVLKNTLIMSGLGIATSWVPMAFAIFLSEIKCKWFRSFVQIFTTIPNFISWVLVYAIAFAIFSTDGFLNSFLTDMTGALHNTDYLRDPSGIWFKMLAWGMWKGVGWSAIIYIAAISGIDVQLYEAATVDGAGRFQKMWHVTLPGLLPTFSVLLLMAVAGILSNGMDQYLVFENAANAENIRVLDLYVYQLGIGSGKIPLSTVIGMLKTVISVILLFAANGISKLVRGESIM